MSIDIQMKMKKQAELAYIKERIEQIKQNMNEQGYNKYEYDKLIKRKDDILKTMNYGEGGHVPMELILALTPLQEYSSPLY